MKASVNERFLFELSGQPHLEVVRQDGCTFQIRQNGNLVKIELLDYNIRSKRFDLVIDGFVFNVKLEDDLDDIVQKISQNSVQDSGFQVVTAPIPGLIKVLKKVEGDGLKKGESVLVLEAMKMENTILSPIDAGRVQYHVAEGDHVSKGQKMFTLLKG